jgi:hypothetical protein
MSLINQVYDINHRGVAEKTLEGQYITTIVNPHGEEVECTEAPLVDLPSVRNWFKDRGIVEVSWRNN